MSGKTGRLLMEFYQAMLQASGPQHWWPGQNALEIVIGAVLTQNTNWANVERAIKNLRKADLIDVAGLDRIAAEGLGELIRPAGYFRVKTKRLKNLMGFIMDRYQGDLEAMFDQPIGSLRRELLSINGVGPETADDIILYAAGKPTFVVDTYTYRVLLRHGLIDSDADYQQIKELFEQNLPEDVQLFNEYHALLVVVGKNHCRPKPRCQACPLECFDHDPNLPEQY